VAFEPWKTLISLLISSRFDASPLGILSRSGNALCKAYLLASCEMVETRTHDNVVVCGDWSGGSDESLTTSFLDCQSLDVGESD